jgi:hypothetical protein
LNSALTERQEEEHTTTKAMTLVMTEYHTSAKIAKGRKEEISTNNTDDHEEE